MPQNKGFYIIKLKFKEISYRIEQTLLTGDPVNSFNKRVLCEILELIET